MKKSVKFVAAALAAGLACAAFAGCNNKEKPNSATDIEISFWEGSFGKTFMEDIVSGFMKKYPEYKVDLRTSKNAQTIANSLQKRKNDTTDIYFNQLSIFMNYTDLFADLSEIVTETIPGETKSIKDKYDKSLYESLKNENGELKTLGWAGSTTGIFYYADVLENEGIDVPRTTDELADLVTSLGKKTSFVQLKDARMGYYQYLVKAWMAQYAGLDYYNNNWLQLKDESGKTPSKDVYLSETDGRKQALDVLGSLLNSKTSIEDPDKFKVARMFNLGDAVMMVNGNWVFGEVDALKEKNIKMMRTPVISALAQKLETVADDEELAALVSAIDNVLDNGATVSLTGSGYDVSQADWDRVYAARTMVYNNGSEHAMIVNKYTNAKDGVKKFIQYYYSDEGLAKFINATHYSANANLTDETFVNTSSWTAHEKEQYARSKTNTNVTDGNATSPVFSKTATLHLYGTVDIVGQLTTTNNPQSAAALWTAFKNNVNDARTGWTMWLKNAGIKG